jgi:hypothetical protein
VRERVILVVREAVARPSGSASVLIQPEHLLTLPSITYSIAFATSFSFHR